MPGYAPPPTVGTALASFIDGLRGPGYRKALGDYADAVLFLPTDDAERQARILAVMTSAPQHVVVSALEGGHAYDASQAKGRLVAPMLYIAADESRPAPTSRAYARSCLASISATWSALAISASSKCQTRSTP